MAIVLSNKMRDVKSPVEVIVTRSTAMFLVIIFSLFYNITEYRMYTSNAYT